MCYHRRLVFTCMHYAWQAGPPTQPCERERAFQNGEVETGCDERWSHGYDTVRVRSPCEACEKQKAEDARRVAAVKEKIREVRVEIERVKAREEERRCAWN
ncbi:hypothetical protein VTJ04DRAFT_5964 [Mycothermus thermophilus]|jgi:hypothetical protein|uniref:uncharacterized protein n=1 Tax=Humicola insolens TaxID=85995 RepID=UPI00374428C3